MLGSAWSLLRQTFSEWSENGAPRLGAALALSLIHISEPTRPY